MATKQSWTRKSDAFLKVGSAGKEADVGEMALNPGRASEASAVGRRVGQFVLEAFIEGGPQGAVFRARRLGERPGGGPVAVKLLRTSSPEPDDLRRLEEQRECLASLRHPAIPRLLGSGRTRDGWSWIATHLVIGRPLIQHATVEELGMAQRLRLMIEVCRAVGHAHQRGVLHPDLWRDSVLVTASGEPRVVGFGTLGSAGIANVGTLCRIMYELLSGARPYLTVLRGAGPPGPAYLPRIRPRPRLSIDHVCLKAIRSRGREGYESALDLADDLQRVLDRRPVSAEPPGVGARLLELLTRRPSDTARSA